MMQALEQSRQQNPAGAAPPPPGAPPAPPQQGPDMMKMSASIDEISAKLDKLIGAFSGQYRGKEPQKEEMNYGNEAKGE